ncbi:hypothetical protein J437_LFUL007989, partial [Ladona fulva]
MTLRELRNIPEGILNCGGGEAEQERKTKSMGRKCRDFLLIKGGPESEWVSSDEVATGEEQSIGKDEDSKRDSFSGGAVPGAGDSPADLGAGPGAGRRDAVAFIKACAKNDPEMNKCATASAAAAVRFMKNGIPEYGVSVLDPHLIKEVKFDRKALGMDMVMRDVELTGLGDSVVKKI